MKIFFLFQEMPQYGLAAANRIAAYTKGVNEAGGKASVLIPFGFKAKEEFEITKTGVFKGAPYTYLSFIPYHPKNRLPFALAGFFFLFKRWFGYTKLLFILLFFRRNYDAVFVYRFGIFYTFLIRLATLGKPIVSELCEIPFMGKKEPQKSKQRRLREKYNFRFFNGFLVISEALINYLNEKGLKKKAVLKVPILSHLPKLPPKGETTNLKTPYILHTGSLSQRKDGILTILKAFGKATLSSSVDFHYYLTGYLKYSSDKDAIEALIQQYQLEDKLTFLGFVSDEKLNELYNNASLAIIYKDENEQNIHCFPTKLSDYLYYGIPTIITNVGEMKFFVQDGVNGYVIPPQNVDLLTEKILAVMQNKDNSKMSKNAHAVALEQFSYKIHGIRILEFFHSLSKK